MTIRNPLPARDDTDESYRQYLVLWRPGKPRSLTWTPNYLDAWTAVQP
jgi:hypothetical protein